MSRAMQPEDIGLPEGTKPNPYANLFCEECGLVPLSAQLYDQQLAKPNRPWICVRYGASAEFDDESFEHIHGISEETA